MLINVLAQRVNARCGGMMHRAVNILRAGYSFSAMYGSA
jgi:hypothetical protein